MIPSQCAVLRRLVAGGYLHTSLRCWRFLLSAKDRRDWQAFERSLPFWRRSLLKCLAFRSRSISSLDGAARGFYTPVPIARGWPCA